MRATFVEGDVWGRVTDRLVIVSIGVKMLRLAECDAGGRRKRPGRGRSMRKSTLLKHYTFLFPTKGTTPCQE